jgi:hypothetical protein
MHSALRFLQFFALGTWVGAILYFSFVVYLIGRLHLAGIVLGVIYLVAAMLAANSARALGSAASVCVALMVILTAISQYLVVARMETLRFEMGSVQATPLDSPMRVAFDRLHGVSVRLEVVVLLAGFVALYLTARKTS